MSYTHLSQRVAHFPGLVAYACIAGSAFLFTKEATKLLPPCTISSLRLLIGSSGLLILNLGISGRAQTVRTLDLLRSPRVVACGLCNTAIPYTVRALPSASYPATRQYACRTFPHQYSICVSLHSPLCTRLCTRVVQLYAYSMRLGVEVWLTAVTSGCAPLFTALLAACLLPSSRPTNRTFVGLLLGLLGLTALATEKQLALSGKERVTSVFGFALLLVASCSKAVASILAQIHMAQAETRASDANKTAELSLQFAFAQVLPA